MPDDSLETEARVGSILELAKVTDTPASSIRAVYACVKLWRRDRREPSRTVP